MNPEQQVCSLELAKRLKELGVKQESLFSYYFNPYHGNVGAEYVLLKTKKDGYSMKGEAISAFTTAELAEMFPASIRILTRE